MNEKNIINNTLKTISGIDTLYYFYESNDLYDDLFLDILDQLEDAKGRFDKRDISYSNKDIKIQINKQAFTFNGKAQGFYWFTHIDEYFTIGFKDHLTNRGLNDIQIQLNANGIYPLSLNTLIKYTDDLLVGFITGYKPLTRVDLNIFVQSDLSWISKEMFVARKRSYISIFKEIATKHQLQTLYIGKKPFLLRLYNKAEELKSSKKKDMMYEYFLNNGFDSLENVFNIEFEMHRNYFKSFKIDTVDDLLQRAELLFQDCLTAIRLVDLSTITDNTIDSKNKNRALTHPLWEHLSTSYKLNDFLALEAPLERIKRKSYRYTIQEAIEEQCALAKKAYIHNIVVDEQFYNEVLETFCKRKNSAYSDMLPLKNDSIDFNNPSIEINIQTLSNLDLEKYLYTLEQDMNNYSDLDLGILIKRHQLVHIELKSRGIDKPLECVF
ncbi:hypothetical protein [Sulfurimonas sp. RIFOXYB12_FULL_35_9]|uniref:hypothetical protein n=1 Tax=Sulfurimonas sp. RIFOXYB12_FULL_35_9 TaxID=1802256 RepID=UPI0025DBED06|nr:hypothetical protein [Sulfurimonas sp. RIFOXYB12_FULL_35_9]